MSDALLWIREQETELQPVLRAARKLVRATLPACTERVHPGWNALSFRLSGQVCIIYPYRGAVKIAFEYGGLMQDPTNLLQQTGSRMKFVILRSAGDVNTSLANLVRSAAEIDSTDEANAARDGRRRSIRRRQM